MVTVPDPLSSASVLKGSRSEPLIRTAVQRAPHTPAYVAKLRRAWRVVVPVRGRLSPRIIAREFSTQSAALSWLASDDGQNAVARERSGHQHSAERRNEPEMREPVMLLRGMVRMDMARRLNAHRVLSLALCSLALVGWGAFAYAAGSSASAERRFREELVHLKASQDQLLAERNQQQAAVGDLSQLQAKLASAREDLETLAQKREQARAQ